MRDLVLRVAHQRKRERALARAVGAHERMDGAALDCQVDAADDLGVADGDMEIADFKKSVCHGFLTLLYGFGVQIVKISLENLCYILYNGLSTLARPIL